ncbi:MAG: hypothetical protein WCT04_11255 [Planctomycetota bacterium]
MIIAIHGLKGEAAQDMPTQLEKRVYYELERFASNIKHVSVRLRDENGPKEGGADKHCQIQLTMRDGVQLVVEQRNSCWLDVVDAAAVSASRTIERMVERDGPFRRSVTRKS